VVTVFRVTGLIRGVRDIRMFSVISLTRTFSVISLTRTFSVISLTRTFSVISLTRVSGYHGY
jgi:hypothetical protein